MTSLSTEIVTGDGRTITVGEIVQLFRQGVNQSVPTQGLIQRLSVNNYTLTNRFSAIDCDTLESIKTFKVYSLFTKTSEGIGRCIDSFRCVSGPHESGELATAISENGRFTARLKKAQGDSNKQLLEIWDRSKHLKTFDTSELDAHGSINTDSQFSSFVWSKSGEQDKLLYVAQRKRPKHLSFFKESTDKSKSSSSPNDPARGEEYDRKTDWGEALEGIEHTILAILDVADDLKITTIDLEGSSLGNAQWLDNDSKVVSVAYNEVSRKLGILYCNNRGSKITIYDWKTQTLLTELESATETFHSPRVNNAGDKFIYLTNQLHGAHYHSENISLYDLKTKTSELLKRELFIKNLPISCFTSDDKHFLFVTSDHLRPHMYVYTLGNGSLSEITFPTTGLSVLDFRYDIILATGSEVNATPTLFVAIFNSSNIGDVVAWHQIEDCVHLDEIEYDAFKIPTQDEKSLIGALFVGPNLKTLRENYSIANPKANDKLLNRQNELPTVAIIHGGPHSGFEISYISTLALYARLGLNCLLINYRGSRGVSEEYLQSLSGRVGQLDVEDCLQAIRYVVKDRNLNPDKLVVQGGSHGGFISCLLSCQDEFRFTSAILRNPVVNIATLHETSDIPDWSYNVALGHQKYDPSWVPSSQDLIKMYECSPMSKSKKAYVPTLMLLGTTDKRVNMFQGERWVDVLKARGVETKCKVYNDRHALSKAEAMADSTITSCIWILSHLTKRE